MSGEAEALLQYETVKVTCPSCGKTETIVQPKGSKGPVAYLCPHCGWPDNPATSLPGER